jgi:hypothetical protein
MSGRCKEYFEKEEDWKVLGAVLAVTAYALYHSIIDRCQNGQHRWLGMVAPELPLLFLPE